MCGICGMIGRGMPDRAENLKNMMNALLHRGPDGGGSFFDSEAALGFRRLAIIDLDHGMQPMGNEDGRLTLVFNGEIYNYRELGEFLQRRGHRFATQSDSEVLLHGYEEWGRDLPNHLRGMFAFAIWDSEKKELFAARDFFGIKPFYYTRTAGGLLFASEIKALLQHPQVPRELNRQALEEYLSFQYSVLPESFFRGIYRLDPGTWLSYTPETDAMETHRYFIPTLDPQAGAESEEEWLEQLDGKLEDTIQAHMVSDVVVGTFLSGGVDSNLLASRFGGHRAYTVGFGERGEKYNEMPWAGERARDCQLSYRGRLISQRELFDAVPEVMYCMDEPTGDASAVALYFLAMEASKDVKVVLSGEGADELFGGYRIYQEPGDLALYQKLPLGLRKALARAAERLPPNVRGRSFLLRGSQTVEERFIGNAKIFSREERESLLKGTHSAQSPAELVRPAYELARGLRDEEKMQQVDLLYWLPGDILQKADRMSMAHSLEVRVPYLDRELFDLARHIPLELKQQKGTTKYLLRRAARRSMDPETSRRPKLGFPVPIRVWLREENGYRRVKETLLGESAEQFFDTAYLSRLLEEHRQGKADNSRKLWTVYTFLTWYQVFFLSENKEVEISELELEAAV